MTINFNRRRMLIGGALGTAAAAGQQNQQIFQMDDELLHRAEGQLLL